MSTESTPRRWPVNSPEPDVRAGFKVQGTNGVTFRKTSWGRWLACAPEGDGNDYSWFAMNSEYAAGGGMELVEVPTDRPADSTPPLAQRLVRAAAGQISIGAYHERAHEARDAVVAVLRELAADLSLGMTKPADGVDYDCGWRDASDVAVGLVRALADSIEKGETRG